MEILPQTRRFVLLSQLGFVLSSKANVPLRVIRQALSIINTILQRRLRRLEAEDSCVGGPVG